MLVLTCGIALLSTLVNIPHAYAVAIPRENSSIVQTFAEENARIIAMLSTAFKLVPASGSNTGWTSASSASVLLPSSLSQSVNPSSGSARGVGRTGVSLGPVLYSFFVLIDTVALGQPSFTGSG